MDKKSELKKKLRAKIEESKIKRSSKTVKDDILKQTLKSIGIDKEKFQTDMEAVKKQGGFTLNLKKDLLT